MYVKDIMTTNVVSVGPETKVSAVADIIHARHFTGVPVVNAEGTVLGVIAERDFITASSNLYLPTYIKLLEQMDYLQGSKKQIPHAVQQILQAKAQDIMNKDLVFVKPETSIAVLAEIFATKRVNPVPVTDGKNKLVGVVSRSDLIQFFSGTQAAHYGETAKLKTVPETGRRDIDSQIEVVNQELSNRFAYVTKARANIWVTAAVVLFIVGFMAGIIYVADPNFLRSEQRTTTPPQTQKK